MGHHLTPLVHRLVEGFALPPSGIHGLAHWARVLENGLRLASVTGADVRVVELFAVFHDCRRRHDGRDRGHGPRAAGVVRSLADELGLEDHRAELLAEACTGHADGRVSDNLTIGTCWDADRLDLWRVGIEPSGRLLSTEAARDPEVHAWARQRSVGGHRPGFLAEWTGLDNASYL